MDPAPQPTSAPPPTSVAESPRRPWTVLGRLTRAVRRQHWFSVSLEIGILVLGVFLGLQANNWNESRKDEARARGYLERFREDLAVDGAALARQDTFWADTQTYGLAALGYAETGTLRDGSAWATLVAFYHATQIWPFNPYDATYREITNAGDLTLIADPDLRSAIGDYVTGYEPQKVIFERVPPYRFTVRGLVPWGIQQAIWDACFETVGLDDYAMIPCAAPVPEAEAQAVLDQLVADPSVVTGLRNWMRNLQLIRDFGALDRRAAAELDDRIADALRR